MKITPDMARAIERLRAAAHEHGAVADLLEALADCLGIEQQLDNSIRLTITESQPPVDAAILYAAVQAAAFAQLDREAQE